MARDRKKKFHGSCASGTSANIVVPMIDSLRFIGLVCYSICVILAYVQMEIMTNLAIPVLFI